MKKFVGALVIMSIILTMGIAVFATDYDEPCGSVVKPVIVMPISE